MKTPDQIAQECALKVRWGIARDLSADITELIAAAIREATEDLTNALAIANRSADEQMRYKREAEAERDQLRAEVEQLSGVVHATRQTSIEAMAEIRAAAGAPLASEDKSTMRAVDYVAQLRAALDVAEGALKPFSHPDLAKLTTGNAQGGKSPVFGRDKAVLTIADFKSAQQALARIAATKNNHD